MLTGGEVESLVVELLVVTHDGRWWVAMEAKRRKEKRREGRGEEIKDRGEA
jgi:hypothetical protein